MLSGLPRWHSGKEYTCQYRRHKRCEFDPWVGTIPWRRAWQPTPLFMPGESHGQGIQARIRVTIRQARLKWLSNSSSSNALSYQKSRGCCSHADRTCCLASLHTACSQGVSSCHPGGERPSLPVCRAHVLCLFSLSVSYRIRNTCHRTLLEDVREMESRGVQVLRRDSAWRWGSSLCPDFCEKPVSLFFPPPPLSLPGVWGLTRHGFPGPLGILSMESPAGQALLLLHPSTVFLSINGFLAPNPEVLLTSSSSHPMPRAGLSSGNLVPLIKTLTSACTPAPERDRFQLLDITRLCLT